MKTWPRDLIFACALALAVCGCGTVHQDAVESRSAGAYVKPIRTEKGYIVDAAFRDRYNALISAYGKRKLENGAPVFAPPLERDQGITALSEGQWLMTFSAMENMVTLVSMQRRGAAP